MSSFSPLLHKWSKKNADPFFGSFGVVHCGVVKTRRIYSFPYIARKTQELPFEQLCWSCIFHFTFLVSFLPKANKSFFVLSFFVLCSVWCRVCICELRICTVNAIANSGKVQTSISGFMKWNFHHFSFPSWVLCVSGFFLLYFFFGCGDGGTSKYTVLESTPKSCNC